MSHPLRSEDVVTGVVVLGLPQAALTLGNAIVGVLTLFTGLFLGDSVATLFKLFPASLLGVILLFGGLELAAGVHDAAQGKEDRYVMLLTAGLAMSNMGAGYLAGLALWHAYQRGWVRA